ncbi:MAG: sulfatase-like hydrolase/transferase [Notoacmeibacter sp.]|nr:sulfatase-like hydrolase/transferase [Notoacmeibacter sp.]
MKGLKRFLRERFARDAEGAIGGQSIIAGTGLALALALTVLRIVILRNEFVGLSGYDRLAAVVAGSRQDWLFVLVLVVATMVLMRIFGAARGIGRGAIAFIVICNILLVWGIANVVAVHMLGEPVTLSWIHYSDVFNAPNIFDSLLHIFSPIVALFIIVAMLAFSLLALLTSLLLAQTSLTRWWPVLASLPVVAVLASYGLPGGTLEINSGKLLNPEIALVRSFFSERRLNVGLIGGGKEPLATDAPPLKVATPVAKPRVKPGQLRNVVLFTFESTSAKYMEGFNSVWPVTPNVRKYSAMGIRFTNIYAHTPASNFALVSLVAAIVPELSPYSMTYSYPDLDFDSIAEVLNARGFRTAFFNSSDNRFQNQGGFMAHVGFDTVRDHRDWPCETGIHEFGNATHQYLNTSNDRCTVPPVIDWIQQAPNRPFFVNIKTGMTHYPYFTGEDPRTYTSDENLNRYLNAVKVADDAFGMVMDFLVERDLLESTLVIVMGDHGEAFGEHGNYVHAAALYEENIHIPLIFINPNLFSGESADLVGGVSDIAPTALDLLGAPVPPRWQGRSLFSSQRNDAVLFFAPWNGFQVGFREGTKKFIFNANSGQSQLYDIKSDPYERNNLADGSPEETERAKRILASWVKAQQAWIDGYLRASGEEALQAYQPSGEGELVIFATGTSFKTPPKAEVVLDGLTVARFEVAAAPANAERAIPDAEVDAAVTTFRFPVTVPECAKRLEIRFLNDEWAGEGKTGDTDLYIRAVELAGHRYGPERYTLATDRAGGPRRDYFALWRTGSFWIDLDVGPECVTRNLVSD